MILPSDDDSRKPGDDRPKGGSGGGEGQSGAPMPWDDGPLYEDLDEDEAEERELAELGAQIQSPAPPGWRDELKQSLLEAIDDLREIEDPSEDFDPPEPPDLFTFYGELVALRNEMRRGSRRASDALAKLGDNQAGEEAARPLAQALLSLLDRAPDPSVKALVESSMLEAGLVRIDIKEGQAFDAASMVTEGKPRSKATVAAELAPGYLWKGRVLRPAKVSLR